MLTNPVELDLPPTRTYAARSCEWIPTRDDGTEGVLVIRLRKTHNGKEEADVYAVERQVSPAPGIVEYLLANGTDAEQPDAYCVTLGGPRHGCTCKAGLCGLACKHTDALTCLAALGAV